MLPQAFTLLVGSPSCGFYSSCRLTYPTGMVFGNFSWQRWLKWECWLDWIIDTHITPVLVHCHWLPIGFWAQFKCLVLSLKSQYGLGSAYLKDHPLPYEPTWPLHSSSEAMLQLPPTFWMFRQVATWEEVPKLWNSSPWGYSSAPFHHWLPPAAEDCLCFVRCFLNGLSCLPCFNY